MAALVHSNAALLRYACQGDLAILLQVSMALREFNYSGCFGFKRAHRLCHCPSSDEGGLSISAISCIALQGAKINVPAPPTNVYVGSAWESQALLACLPVCIVQSAGFLGCARWKTNWGVSRYILQDKGDRLGMNIISQHALASLTSWREQASNVCFEADKASSGHPGREGYAVACRVIGINLRVSSFRI